MSKRVYISNIPLETPKAELQKTLQAICQNIKLHMYQKDNQPMSCGEIRFQLQSELDDFLRQVRVKPVTILNKTLVFSQYKENLKKPKHI